MKYDVAKRKGVFKKEGEQDTNCRQSTEVKGGQRRSKEVKGGQRRSKEVKGGQRRSKEVKGGQRRLKEVKTRLTRVNGGGKQPPWFNTSNLTYLDENQSKSTQVKVSQREENKSWSIHESTSSILTFIFICLLFYLLMYYL